MFEAKVIWSWSFWNRPISSFFLIKRLEEA